MLASPLALAGCGPLPLEDAERVCIEDARAAVSPRGEVGIGIGSDGDGIDPVGRFEISVSSDYIMGRDPSVVFAQCVQRRAGQPPSRPLYEQPGWGVR
ncbi:hypothetical protein PAE61_12045 [Paracoccus aerodenitrificans]|nr:hypothetical protein [Paracoccus aerodenitrificans]WBU63091.1 hypothetical protein PAE61_12045 [Paracoccus aerodenitrificans]